MNTIFYVLLVLGLLMLVYVGGFTLYREFGIEKPKYEVLEKKSGYEIRKYEPYVIASYTRSAGGINGGFMQVAGYIFGDNQSRKKIAMTSPVIDSVSEKGRTTSFVLPSAYSIEDLPIPNNPDLEMIEVPETHWAVMRFSAGAYRNDVLNNKRDELLGYLLRDDVISSGEYQFAFYDPPGLVWPFRRDEVWVKLK